MQYRVKVIFRGSAAHLGHDLSYAPGRYDWIGGRLGKWMVWCHQRFGLLMFNSWTEVRR